MANIKFSGNIGKEPELRYAPDGTPILNFSVALYTGGTKKSGYNESVWVRVSAFDELAERMGDTLTKGAKITITGTPRPPRVWQDKDGNARPAGLEVTAYEIELGDGFKVESEDVPF